MTSWWAHCEFTVNKMQSRDLAVSSPRSKCSPWQFDLSWDFHTDLVLHASSFVPLETDFDHLVQKAICHKYKVTRFDYINWKCSWFTAQLLHNLCLKRNIDKKTWVEKFKWLHYAEGKKINPKLHGVNLVFATHARLVSWKYIYNNIFQLYIICSEHEWRKICTNSNDNMPKYISLQRFGTYLNYRSVK